MESRGSRVNLKRTEIKIRSENAAKITDKDKFLRVVCRKGVYSNTIRYWVHKRCSGTRSKLKEDSKFKCQTYANQQRDIAVDFLGIELNRHSLEIVERFCYLGNTNAKE